MTRQLRRTRVPLNLSEGLESRRLLAAGALVGAAGVVMDLGTVSGAAAARGVEVAATVAAHGSVTFRFDVQTPGDYRLEVRHLGQGLTLEATGPAGSASVDPGPAGPSRTIALPLEAAGYEITATAGGDRPVFVDWELLLASGIGQSAAAGPTLPAAQGPASPQFLPPAPPAPSPAAGASTPGGASATSPGSGWDAALARSTFAPTGPAGRTSMTGSVVPTSPAEFDGTPTTTPEDARGVDPAAARSSVPDDVAPTQGDGDRRGPEAPWATTGLLADAAEDAEALGGATWIEDLVGFHPAPDAPPTVDRDGEAVESRLAVADLVGGDAARAASPGLIVVGLFAVSSLRRWRKGRGLPWKRPRAVPSDLFPRSMKW